MNSLLARVKDVNILQARTEQDPDLLFRSRYRSASFNSRALEDFPILTLDLS